MAASWECPSLPMLSFPMKESSRASFLGLKPLISAHYEENPESFGEEIKQLDQLREHAMHPSKDYNGCSVMRRYFAQLHLIRARFPPETVGQVPIDFAWKDAYTATEYIQDGLQIEQASILYNISALHSQLGCRGRRDTEQEMKEAVTHFQCAAGAYCYLDEHFAINHASKDLSPEFVTLYKNLMLGQAQECLVEKSLKGLGRVKNLTIAKLAARVAEYYSQVGRSLDAEPCIVIAKKYKEWPKLMKIKVFYFLAVSHFYQAAHAEELGKYGEMITFNHLAHQKLQSIGKIPKSVGEVVKDAVRNFGAHATEKLQAARRQNEQVYHDIVPAPDTLEFALGADLVKPVTFHPTDPKNLGTDILARLIPMRAHEAASVFSEEKAKLLRSLTLSVEEKEEEVEQFMRSLNVEEIEQLHEGPPDIPEDVLQQHHLLQGKAEDVRKLHSGIQELMSLSTRVSENLSAIAELQGKEEEEEKQFQAKFGSRPASQIVANLWKELESYRGYHTQASKSNTELKAMFDQHFHNLVLLSGPLSTVHSSLPKMTLMDAPPENSADSNRWKELMGKVKKMRQQRAMLLGQLRDQMNGDDIIKTLVGHLGGSEQESIIEEHMKRHREIADIIRTNLSAQERILVAVTEANAKQAVTRQAAQELKQQQENMFSSLVKSAGFLSLLQSKIKEGLGFYTRLCENVSKLKEKSSDICEARRGDRGNTERQRAPPPEQPPPTRTPPPEDTAEEPKPGPPRPPKKSEQSGVPIPPEQQKLPPLIPPNAGEQQQQQIPNQPQPSNAESSADVVAAPATSLEQQLLELQKFQQLQMGQLKQLDTTGLVPGGAGQSAAAVVPPNLLAQPPQVFPGRTPSSLEGKPQYQAGSVTEEPPRPHSSGDTPRLTSPAGGQPSSGGLSSEKQPGLPSETGLLDLQPSVQPPVAMVMDTSQVANQAVLDLQMLLEPPSDSAGLFSAGASESFHPQPAVSLGEAGSEGPDQLDIPVRPPKPAYLQSAPKQQPSQSHGSQISAPSSEISMATPSQPYQLEPEREDKPTPPFQPQPYRPMSPMGGGSVAPIPPQILSQSPFQNTSFPAVDLVAPPSASEDGFREQVTVASSSTESITPIPEGGVGVSVSSAALFSSIAGMGLSHIPPLAPLDPTGAVNQFVASSQMEQDISHQPGENTVTTSSSSRPIPAVQSPPPHQLQPTLQVVDPNLAGLQNAPFSPDSYQSGFSPSPAPEEPQISSPSGSELSQPHRFTPAGVHVVDGVPEEPKSLPDAVRSRLDSSNERQVPSAASDLSSLPQDAFALHQLTQQLGKTGGGISAVVPKESETGLASETCTAALSEDNLPTTGFAKLQPLTNLPEQALAQSGSGVSATATTTTDGESTSSADPTEATAVFPARQTPELEASQPDGSPSLSASTAKQVSRSQQFPTVTLPTQVSSPPLDKTQELSLSTSVGTLSSVVPKQSPSLATLVSSGADFALSSLATIAMSGFQPLTAPLTLPAPPSIPEELAGSLAELPSLLPSDAAHLESLLAKQQDTIHEQSKELEQQKQQIDNQAITIEEQKQQILLLQQQVLQQNTLQQKQDQDKATASGQQTALMQLLQQQQGLFSQQQAQLEKLNQTGEDHRRELQEAEVKYKETLAVQQQQNLTLQNQLAQQSQELQRSQQQLQAQVQQSQALQLQLQQYNTQIQERDKQLLAFRDQHKQIVQSLEQRHQQKVHQLVQQYQELQAELKKAQDHNRMQQQQQAVLRAQAAGLQQVPQPQTGMSQRPPISQPAAVPQLSQLHAQMQRPPLQMQPQAPHSGAGLHQPSRVSAQPPTAHPARLPSAAKPPQQLMTPQPHLQTPVSATGLWQGQGHVQIPGQGQGQVPVQPQTLGAPQQQGFTPSPQTQPQMQQPPQQPRLQPQGIQQPQGSSYMGGSPGPRPPSQLPQQHQHQPQRPGVFAETQPQRPTAYPTPPQAGGRPIAPTAQVPYQPNSSVGSPMQPNFAAGPGQMNVPQTPTAGLNFTPQQIQGPPSQGFQAMNQPPRPQ